MPTPGQRQQLGALLLARLRNSGLFGIDPALAIRVSSAAGAASLVTAATTSEPLPLPSDQSQRHWGYSFAAAPLAVAAAWALSSQASSAESTDQALTTQSKGPGFGKLFSLHTRQRVFFNYEKRIRDMSSLDKVFNYFSSEERQHESFMLPGDLLNAIVPTYPASRSVEERAGALAGERRQHSSGAAKQQDRQNQFFARFDLDGDGLLAFAEFQLMVTLLSIPEKDVDVVFDAMDLDGSGVIDAREFHTIIKQLQGRAGINSYNIKRLEAKEKSCPPGSTSASGLLVSFFGADQTGKLELQRFSAFCCSLRKELLRLEFLHYCPDENEMIPGIDFARSLVVAADMGNVDAHLNRVEAQAERLSSMSISFAEFEAVHEVQKRMHAVKVALEFMSQMGRPISRRELERAVYKFTGVQLSGQVLDIMMITFDDGRGQGCLDHRKFSDAMRRKSQFWARRVNSGH